MSNYDYSTGFRIDRISKSMPFTFHHFQLQVKNFEIFLISHASNVSISWLDEADF